MSILTWPASQNITSITCEFPDRDRGTVGTVVTFTSMGVALIFVGMHVMAFCITRSWGWADVTVWIVTVSDLRPSLVGPY